MVCWCSIYPVYHLNYTKLLKVHESRDTECDICKCQSDFWSINFPLFYCRIDHDRKGLKTLQFTIHVFVTRKAKIMKTLLQLIWRLQKMICTKVSTIFYVVWYYLWHVNDRPFKANLLAVKLVNCHLHISRHICKWQLTRARSKIYTQYLFVS